MTSPTSPHRRDEGSALIMVLGAMTVAMLVVSVALSYGLQTMRHAAHSAAWYQAFAAAEAGIDDYLARLNADDNYWQTVDCDNPALQGATSRTNDCGWTTATDPGWLDVPGATGGQFHYDADVTQTPVDGTIDLVATGRVAGAETTTRSLEVTLRRGGFGEFLYYTVYETKDPADYANPTYMYPRCTKYKWAGRPNDCTDINFIGGDRINGPLHSNDSILIGANDASGNGPWFKGTVTTSLPTCDARTPTTCYRTSTSGTRPRFDKGIAYRSEVELPDSIGDLRQYVVDGPDAPPTLGCLYTGPTRITFIAPSGGATPTMKVWSPYSDTATLNPGCAGSPVTTGQTWPRTVDVPQNNLIMVQDVPSSQSPQPPSTGCAAGSLGKVPDTSTGTDLPNGSDWGQTRPEASCRYGTAYVEGTLKGRVTISADNDIVVVGNLTYQGGQNGTDALGLIAENSVQIYHPISKGSCTQHTGDWVWRNGRWRWDSSAGDCIAWARGSSNLTGSLTDPTIYASVLTLQHSFEVQQYDVGASLGSIHLYGAIAQRYRGLVGTSGYSRTGYLKDYNYDSRLRYAPPPYFLDPVRSSWGQKTFGEVAPRYGG